MVSTARSSRASPARGRSASARDTEDYQERVDLDTWYALNRNFWLDIKIIGQTVIKVLTGSGAY